MIGLGLLAASAPALMASTVAYWRFEGTADTQVNDGTSAGNTYEPGTGVLDSSGNGNDLSVWDEGGAGLQYKSDVTGATIPQNGLSNTSSVKNSGGYPAGWCATTAMQTWTPTNWTIEVAFQPELTDGFRTLVGRDSRYTATSNADLAALYLQITPSEQLAIKYCDEAGFWHEAISAANLVQGFNWSTDNNGTTGQWQGAAAVCDGLTLSLYYKNIELGDVNYTLVAQADLLASGSSNLALTDGNGSSGGDWTGGNWTVGRGLYAGGHGDRAYGFVDEVRISDEALTPSQFLFVPEPATALLSGLGLLGFLRRRR